MLLVGQGVVGVLGLVRLFALLVVFKRRHG
jgi:hypothetical protein